MHISAGTGHDKEMLVKKTNLLSNIFFFFYLMSTSYMTFHEFRLSEPHLPHLFFILSGSYLIASLGRSISVSNCHEFLVVEKMVGLLDPDY